MKKQKWRPYVKLWPSQLPLRFLRAVADGNNPLKLKINGDRITYSARSLMRAQLQGEGLVKGLPGDKKRLVLTNAGKIYLQAAEMMQSVKEGENAAE